MSNIFQNRIDTAMTPVQLNATKTALQTAESNMPFLTGLTVDERVSLPKINVSNKVFTEDAITAIVNNASLFPAYLEVAKMQSDLTMFTQLDEVRQILSQMLERVEDTQMLAGSEAYVSALAAYRLIGAAATAGVPGMDTVYAQLKERFENNGAAGGNGPLPA